MKAILTCITTILFPFTVLAQIDTSKRLKLYKTISLLHGAYYTQSKHAMQERHYIYELTMPSQKDLEIADIYFKKYQRFAGK